ncbi:hypothetical protein MRB53_023242 [Persea americana]|uniref:Uncharacterized protein n=1 Tax=Persea americana TaxID=3435 RepID=A0ACC2L8V8_PERAE|nr:hypothetical protein MRB53_023242 [Persea americana]
MEGTATTTTARHRFSPFFSISSHSNLSFCNKSPLTKTPFKSTNGFLSLRDVKSSVKDKRPNSNRSVSAVRLLRMEQGGAFVDLLNDKGKNSGENKMGYVERTLGFRTRDLDDRDIRLV